MVSKAGKSLKSQTSLPVIPSEYGRYVAVLNANRLSIVPSSGGADPVRSIVLNDHLAGFLRFLRWSPSPRQSSSIVECSDSRRILCASPTQVSVWDLWDDKWSATIETGDASSFVHVDFGASHDEVITVYEFNTQLAICSLTTGEQRIIKSPKCPNSRGYAFRPGTGHLAVLIKLDANDILTLHDPETYHVITSVHLPTADAQGLKWSPNGAWLAVWEAAAAGTKVSIYTADGQYFRSYSGSTHELSLGIKVLEWSPDSNLLALGLHDTTVELISSTTFTLAMTLGDPTLIGSSGMEIYREGSSNIGNVHEYSLVPQAPDFPYMYDTPTGTRAISLLSFNPTGNLLATVQQAMPHIVWIWSIQCQIPRLVSALIQKSGMRQLLWSPKFPELLMTINDDDVPVVHQWIRNRIPRIARIPAANGGRYAISWVKADTTRNGFFWFGWQTGYVIGCVVGNGSNARFMQVLDMDDELPALCDDELPSSYLEEGSLQ